MDKQIIKQQLVEARKKIENLQNWCRGSLFEQYNTYDSDGNSKTVTQYCVLGACGMKQELNPQHKIVEEVTDLLNDISIKLYKKYAHEVNDDMTHKDVLNLLDQAILYCE